jgi:hypothetical protein
MRLVRWLALSVGVLFLLGTLLQLVDFLNLYAAPPEPPRETMVENRLASYDYRVKIWPIFFLGNLSFGIAFVIISGLGLALASWLANGSSRRIGIATTFGVGGVLGAAGQLIIIGAAKATIDIQYCDCGFRDTEIVSQIWAQMIAEGAAFWLINAASVLAAIGIVAVGSAFRDAIPASLGMVGWLTAIGLVAAVLVPQFSIGPEELAFWLQVVVSGVLVPAWAIWLGLSLGATAGDLAPEAA